MTRVTQIQLMTLLISLFVISKQPMQAGIPSGISTGLFAKILTPVDLFKTALDGALSDKRASDVDNFLCTDFDEKFGDINEDNNVSQDALIWLEDALFDEYCEDDGYAKRALKRLRDFSRTSLVCARDFSYAQLKRLRDYSRACYWSSKVILPEEREYNRVFVFNRTAQQADMVNCKTTDGYEFLIPQNLIGNGFLDSSVSGNFIEFVNHLRYAEKINLNSRVMYFLCVAKLLQHTSQTEKAKAQLEGIAMRLKDRELFDAIKACRFLRISHVGVLNSLNHAVASVLQMRHPLNIARDLIAKELSAYSDQMYQQVLAAFKKVALVSLSMQELLVNEASVEASVPSTPAT